MDASPNDPNAEGQAGPSCAMRGCPLCRPRTLLVLVLVALAILAWARMRSCPGPKLNPQAVQEKVASPVGGPEKPARP